VEAQQTSLYERLGGIYVIATAVDDFIDRIMVDDRLNAILASTRRTIACRRRGSSTS
jgi:truncated hemoglobin YjbI